MSLKKAWNSVRDRACIDCRFHDLSHTVTKWLKRVMPEATMLDIMGHMSAVMLRRYSHIRRGLQASDIVSPCV